jgi:hypothetical protein
VGEGEDVSHDVFPEEQVEVEEMRRRQARRSRGEDARQEKGDGQDEHEEEEVRTEEEEKSMWNRKTDVVAIDRGKKILYLLEFKRRTDQRADFKKRATARAEKHMKMLWEH